MPPAAGGGGGGRATGSAGGGSGAGSTTGSTQPGAACAAAAPAAATAALLEQSVDTAAGEANTLIVASGLMGCGATLLAAAAAVDERHKAQDNAKALAVFPIFMDIN